MRATPTATRSTSQVHVVATDEHRRARLLVAAREGGAAIAPSTVSIHTLVRALHRALLPHVALAHPLIERVAASLAATKVRGGAGYTRATALASALDVLRRNAIDGDALERSLAEVDASEDGARKRLGALAEASRLVDERLEAEGLVARAGLEGVLARAIDAMELGEALPAPIGPNPTHVRVTLGAAGLDLSRARLLAALGRALQRRGGGLSLRVLVEPARERWSAALDRALRVFEDDEESPVELELGLREDDGETHDGLRSFVEALAAGGRAVDAPVEFAEAHGPDESARWAIATVERWIDAGMEPEEIAIVLRTGAADEVEPIVRALDEAGLRARLDEACARGIERPGAAIALVSLARALAEGGEVERVTFALAALAGPKAIRGHAPTTLAHAARAVRARTVFDPKLELLGRHVSPATAEAASALRELVAPLGTEGTVEQHCARWLRFLRAIAPASRHQEAARSLGRVGSDEPATRAMLRASTREERALDAIERSIEQLAPRARRAGLASVIDAESFASLLEDAIDAAREALDGASDAGTSGVRVTSVESVVGATFRGVVVVGIEDGRFPAHVEEDSLLGEVERRAVKKSAGVLVVRRGAKEDEAQLFLAACAASSERLGLVGSRHDAGGRALAPSPFMVDVRRVLDRAPQWLTHDPLARSRAVVARGSERLTRAWAGWPSREALAKAAMDTGARALFDRVRSAVERAEIERERTEFFAGLRAEPGRFSGRIDHDPRAIAALELARYATTAWPLDVTSLERTARCAFKAFAQQVLKLEPEDLPSLALDAKERGHLLHALLEAGQIALHGTQGRPRAVRWEKVEAALDKAAERFGADLPHADTDLLRADTVAIRRMIEGFLEGRMDADTRWSVVATEVAFGPEREWPALEVEVDGESPIVLRGRIDGVERLDESVRAVEFKSGRGDGFRKRLREGALDTQFQLVVYASALYRAVREGRVDATGVDVDGVYVGFRDQTEHGLRDVLAKPRRGGGDAPIADVESLVRDGAQGKGALGEAVRKAVLPVRQGVFAPRPRDCDFCNAQSLCRVERGREEH
ncbi:MAG: PD-(D/E)XK nuclease family protein [Myxococcales bacterium]|nr:PD-(D/E)XK nuclease family protein [Myxococcales bacterium]